MSHPRLVALAVVLFSVLFFSRSARGEAPGPRVYPVYVLSLDTDDVDDQAEALSSALRSRVRNAGGWSLSETGVTLSMLTAALKCPRQPDAHCLAKIGEHLKADRFIWGTMQKAQGSNVRVDLHLWSRNKPEQQSAAETYSDNLKDQNDERLLRVAQRLFERLTGALSVGTLTIHAGEGGGVVMVDGQRKGALEKGDITLELPTGSHVVEVRVQGFAGSRDSVTVAAGKESRLKVNLVPLEKSTPEPSEPGPSGRKVGGWAAVGVGGALVITGGIETLLYLNKNAEQEKLLQKVPKTDNGNPTTACEYGGAHAGGDGADARAACDANDSAKKISTLAWVFGAAGAATLGVGLYLVVTDPGPEKRAPKFEDRVAKRNWPSVRVVPAVSWQSQGLRLEGAF